MTAERAEVMRLEAEAWDEGFRIGFKTGFNTGITLATYFEALTDTWTVRFGGPMEEALSDRLEEVEDPPVLRRCFNLVIRAADTATATREIEELLARC